MNNEEVVQKIISVVCDITGISQDEIEAKTSLMDELEISSLEVVAIMGDLESAFHVKITEKDMRTFTTIQDVADFLVKKKSSL